MAINRILFRSLRVFSISVITLIAVAACGQKHDDAAPPPTAVGVIIVQPTSVALTTELPGRTNAYLMAEVRARVDGIVQKRQFIEGAEVKAGQKLYTIDPAPYQVALDSAKATLARAQANVTSTRLQLERFKALVAENAISKQEYDNANTAFLQAQADVASGKAAVSRAQINLSYTAVVSPISGRIGKSQVTEGAYVQQSQATLLATVQKINPIYVDLTQSSNDLLRMRRDIQNGKLQNVGQKGVDVTLLLEDGSTYPEKGKLEFSDITVDPNTGTVTTRALFPNAKHDLLPGMFVRARIQEAVNDNVFLVPQQGITRNQKGEATALIVDSNNKVELKILETSQTLGDKWVVSKGLKPGERVIVEGTIKVQPGMTVKPEPIKSLASAQVTQTKPPQIETKESAKGNATPLIKSDETVSTKASDKK